MLKNIADGYQPYYLIKPAESHTASKQRYHLGINGFFRFKENDRTVNKADEGAQAGYDVCDKIQIQNITSLLQGEPYALPVYSYAGCFAVSLRFLEAVIPSAVTAAPTRSPPPAANASVPPEKLEPVVLAVASSLRK